MILRISLPQDVTIESTWGVCPMMRAVHCTLREIFMREQRREFHPGYLARLHRNFPIPVDGRHCFCDHLNLKKTSKKSPPGTKYELKEMKKKYASQLFRGLYLYPSPMFLGMIQYLSLYEFIDNHFYYSGNKRLLLK